MGTKKHRSLGYGQALGRKVIFTFLILKGFKLQLMIDKNNLFCI
jgi:hypothetical protein